MCVAVCVALFVAVCVAMCVVVRICAMTRSCHTESDIEHIALKR